MARFDFGCSNYWLNFTSADLYAVPDLASMLSVNEFVNGKPVDVVAVTGICIVKL
jgi:hypothetical protein